MSGPKIGEESQIERRLRLRDLRIFSAVAEHRSMAKAAAALGVAQPSISEVISDLEHNYRVKLFDRSPRGVQLTAYGEALLKRSIVVFDEIRQSARDIEFLADPTVGQIRIACVESLSATILPEILLQFTRKHPRVVLHVDNLTAPATDMTDLRNRKYDLALIRMDVPASSDASAEDLNIQMLFDDGLTLAVGCRNPLAARPSLDLEELIDEPWILSPPGYWHYSVVEQAFRARGLSPPKARIITLTVTLRMQLLAGGPFVSVFGSSLMRLNARRFGITTLPVALPRQPWPVIIVTLRNRTQSPVVERFIETAHAVAETFASASCQGLKLS